MGAQLQVLLVYNGRDEGCSRYLVVMAETGTTYLVPAVHHHCSTHRNDSGWLGVVHGEGRVLDVICQFTLAILSLTPCVELGSGIGRPVVHRVAEDSTEANVAVGGGQGKVDVLQATTRQVTQV
jgi:hypothetical protein